MSSAAPSETRSNTVPLALQVTAWGLGLLACVVAMLDRIGEWAPSLAQIQLVGLALAPVFYMLPSRRRMRDLPVATNSVYGPIDWRLCLMLGGLSFFVNAGIGKQFGDLPPAYHDEFSYLFQARTLLAGRLSFPSHPDHPELFDQMHVLNEGRMASRYYPGTGLWLAPFVALDRPFVGQWLACAIATMLTFWTGREIGGRQTAFYAGLAMALSPGIGLFGNTLLSHPPTLMAVSCFLLAITRWQRSRDVQDAWMAGCGLSFAMLCRPMTAAAIGLPFGIVVVAWLLQRPAMDSGKRVDRRWGTLLGLGLPLLFGWGIMIWYHMDVTGNWRVSPYQLYTDIYTPRHVYGFNNVVRGEQHLGPKVIDAYDRWAENLTVELAFRNLLNRWIGSWLWTFDGLPLLICSVVVMAMLARLDRRWTLLVLSLASLYLLHFPYWYVGIMGWHYVFESAPLWCLIFGGGTHLLLEDWKGRGLNRLPLWWRLMLVISLQGVFLTTDGFGKSRLQRGVQSLKYPRQRHAELRRWVEKRIQLPALVLLDQKETVDSHLDLVVNEPGLNAELLLGHYRPGQTDINAIRRAFPDRNLYIASPEKQTIIRIAGD